MTDIFGTLKFCHNSELKLCHLRNESLKSEFFVRGARELVVQHVKQT